jgi:hypothetical protein
MLHPTHEQPALPRAHHIVVDLHAPDRNVFSQDSIYAGQMGPRLDWRVFSRSFFL